MAYSIVQVARMAKVTSRTLRHYDEIGLLRPAHIGGNGYRYYEREQLLRLQQIRVLRELGLGLDTIGDVLDRQTDQLDALRLHHEWLLAERDRFDRLATTVRHTIEKLEGGKDMNAENLYRGFARDSEQAERHAQEAERRWGSGARESHERVKGWSAEKWEAVQREGAAASAELAELMRDGVPADDPRTIEATDAHYRWICHFWTPDRESYTGLGQLYVDDERFTANIDETAPGLAAYLREAMAAYAGRRL
ncbi:MerR family transcriptional regulator [Amycolatopsis cihanbeyliensis]|uniref:DNA-binding transcriptional MerR regulator n=1 Tax=Amycolatopsis cihanbeyliensis TaxID=1128664 RepID=A0A542DN38_AMYCI|nr:MerR family transcriptional regulator [Amycolatopsis cihanbeyliensis]TQJ04477.1 DNA-binding transcriptional MerR regulator [Amycolatopsis cihanbeyliensis]